MRDTHAYVYVTFDLYFGNHNLLHTSLSAWKHSSIIEWHILRFQIRHNKRKSKERHRWEEWKKSMANKYKTGASMDVGVLYMGVWRVLVYTWRWRELDEICHVQAISIAPCTLYIYMQAITAHREGMGSNTALFARGRSLENRHKSSRH